MTLIIMLLVLVLLLILGIPIAYSIGGSGVLYMLLTQPSFLLSFPQRVWSGTNSFIIIAMPLFMLAGELMNYGGLTKRLINFALLLVRPIKGGLGEVNIVASMIFGGITGSSVADTSALGCILIPDMQKKGYPKGFATGLTVASSTVGMIIPPSIPMLMYSMVSGASVGKLFLAGMIPGVLIGLSQLILTYTISRKRHYHKAQVPLTVRDGLKTAKDGTLAMLMPVLIIVTVSFGICTASESAGIALLYAFFLGFFIYRELKKEDLKRAIKKTAVLTASIMIIGGFTMIFTWILALEQIPSIIGTFLLDSNIPTIVVFLFLDVLILALGTFLDVVPCILLLVPVLLPVMEKFGMSELQFGMILIVGLAIGLVTPPVGMCLNVGTKISGLPIVEIFKEAMPFLICNLIILLLVTFIPAISNFLPSIF